MSREQIKMFETEVTEAADDAVEAMKKYKDAKDRYEVTVKHCADMLKKYGIANKQYIRHDGYIIELKEGEVKEDKVLIRKDKDQ
jgi:hypothetical protein